MYLGMGDRKMIQSIAKISDVIRNYITEARNALEVLPVDRIAQVVELIEEARQQAKNVIIFGNGGSAATASHFASDLSKGAICPNKPGIKAFALTDNISLLSAWANDTGYENIFAGPLENMVEPGDVVIGISGSGKSKNVCNGVRVAKERGAATVCFTGFEGGELKDMVDIDIVVPSSNMEQIEDIHLLIGHVITTYLREGI